MSTATERYQHLLDACPVDSCLWKMIQAMIQSEEISNRARAYPVIKTIDGTQFSVNEFGLIGERRLKPCIDRPADIEIEFAINLFDALEFTKAKGRSMWYRGWNVLSALNAFQPRFGAGAFCVACFQLGIPIKPNFRIQLDESVDVPEPNFWLQIPRVWFESIEASSSNPVDTR